MKSCSLIPEEGDEIFHVRECGGLNPWPGIDDFSGCFPITLCGLAGERGARYLPPDAVFELRTTMHAKPVRVGDLRVSRLLREYGDEQLYLASFRSMDVQMIALLDCFLEGTGIHFRELSTACLSSWLSASSIFHFTYGRRGHFAGEISLDVAGLRSRDEFYCHLGQIFFGQAGYAGRDLDGCHEILVSQIAGAAFTVHVAQEQKVRAFLTKTTGRSNYYDRFQTMIEDAGGKIACQP